MFNQNLFNQKQNSNIQIPQDTEIIFVADMFSSDYVGGAELTTDALIDSSPLNVFRIHSNHVTMEILERGFDCYWIFGNFANLNKELIPSIVGNLDYSVLEYDYKYCRYRSSEKHEISELTPCGCHNEITGKMVSAFYYGAKTIWWMSEMQMEKYHNLFPFLSEKNNVVLSSVFDEQFFLKTKILLEKFQEEERKGWIVLGSTSWIKGAEDAENWCKDNELDYEVVWGLPYDQVLEKLVQSEGFVYLPPGGDTCPRMVIEAKLLGCKLHINENVQHASELWFDTEDEFDTQAYLYAARERFWNGIKYDMTYTPSISGYTTTRNCIDQGYPYVESIQSLLGFCDEVCVVDGGSTDGTWEKLTTLAAENDRIKIHQEKRDWSDLRFAVFDGLQKDVARKMCTGQFCWQQDSDEIVHENDYLKVKELIKNFPAHADLIALPVIEYWGGSEKVRMDVNPWKWRLSRNKEYIGHGIPKHLRKKDKNGNLYSSPGTDGCDYIHNETYEPIKFLNFYTQDVEQARRAAFSNPQTKQDYESWFNKIVENIPGVHHYSWFNLDRKIKTYRDYWSKHWQSLYDISQEDTAENNMFFDKPWSKVSDKDITSLSDKLAKEMGGWIFHSRVDFNNPTPHLKIQVSHPEVISEWIKKQDETK